MKSPAALLAIIFAAALALLALAVFAPFTVPYYQDFSVMYFTGRGLLAGIPIYAYPAQLAFVKPLTPAEFSFLPYPYPPWYALATLFTALLPIQAAARLWFFLNMSMLGFSAWLLTPGWRGTARILAIFAAIMFIPAFGLLVVGQYSAPVLVGAALFVVAARQKRAFLTAIALLLMTFKPHIGALIFLAGFVWLIFERSPYSRRTIWLTVLGGLLLAALGFLADPAWPLTYMQSLTRYRDIPGVQTCGLCASLPVALVRLATGQASTAAGAVLSILLTLLAAGLLFGRYRTDMKEPAFLMAVMCTLTLLIDPYLLNYDYILLLLPLFWLARPVWTARLALLVYFVPWLILVIGRNGNIILSMAGLVTFILILLNPIPRSERPIDLISG